MKITFNPHIYFNTIEVSIEQGERWFAWEIETLGL